MPEIAPLASILRPQKLSEYFGQSHLVGEGKPLRLAIEQKKVFSMIFWGPPGVGKTTLARIYANALGADFVEVSAVSAGKADIKKVVERSEKTQKTTVLFLDEIHRFNKAQQDYLLPFVESGVLTLIGATTENPSFSVISPLLSRCRIFVLKELEPTDLNAIIDHALNVIASVSAWQSIKIDSESKDWLVSVANGDARQVLNLLENCYQLYHQVTVEDLKNTLQSKFLRFDKQGEEHYNLISAMIKSMRASNPDAALYYLARLVESGEDPLFIARRMVIFASEDIGLAQPTALVVANAVFQSCQQIGYPECAINLSHGVLYLSKAAKDRSVYDGLKAAQADVQATGNLPIPMSLRNAPTKLMSAIGGSAYGGKNLGYGSGYEMYTSKDLLPDQLKGKKYFNEKK